jgi:SAM-dependent methyltransferase
VSVDPLAAAGFGGAAAVYERGRAGYPAEALDWLARELGLGGSARVLDLGAGTGKLTRSLVGRGLDVVAVEPLDGMRAELSRLLPDVEAVSGFAEAIPLEDASVAAVFSGEAFHWFDLEPTLAEIRRVLVAGGGLAVLWNVPLWKGAWVEEVGQAITRHRDAREHPWQRTPKPWAFDARMHNRDDWTPVRTASFPNPQRFDAAGVLDHVASISFIAALGDEERAAALGEVERVLVRHRVADVVLEWRCDAHVTRPV